MKQVLCTLLLSLTTLPNLISQDLYLFVSDSTDGVIRWVNLDEKKESLQKLVDLPDVNFADRFYVDQERKMVYYRDSFRVYEYDIRAQSEQILREFEKPFFSFTYDDVNDKFYLTVERIGSYDLWEMDSNGKVTQRSMIIRDHYLRHLQVAQGSFSSIFWWAENRSENEEEDDWYIVKFDPDVNVINEFPLSGMEMETMSHFVLDNPNESLYFIQGSRIIKSGSTGGDKSDWIYNADTEEIMVNQPLRLFTLYDEDREDTEGIYWTDAGLEQIALCGIEGDEPDDRDFEVVYPTKKSGPVKGIPYQLRIKYMELDD